MDERKQCIWSQSGTVEIGSNQVFKDLQQCWQKDNCKRAIIWKSGKWGKLKFCDFSFNMGQNLKFKKSYIVKSNSGLNLSY